MRSTAPIVHIGTIGESVWRSDDGGESFRRVAQGMWFENNVRSLAHAPTGSMLAGTDNGLYRSSDGMRWEHVPSPMDGKQTWSLAFSPHDPAIAFAGTCPSALYVSRDGGSQWQECAGDPIAQSCFGGSMVTRTTCFVPHPTKPQLVFAGIEVDGPRRSTDGGNTWHRIGPDPLATADIHDIAFLGDGTLICATNHEIYRSRDDGATWVPLNIREHFRTNYCRGLAVPPEDSSTLYVGVGDAPPGSTGSIYRSRDAGDSWELVPIHATANSTIWAFASLGRWMYAYSVLGQVYRSADGGGTWGKLEHEFGEIRAMCCSGG